MIIAKEGHTPRSLSGDVFKRQVSFLQVQSVGLHIFGGSADLAAFAAAKVFGIHLRTAFPPTSRAPRGLTVREGPLAAASPQTPWLGGNRLRASLGDLPVI